VGVWLSGRELGWREQVTGFDPQHCTHTITTTNNNLQIKCLFLFMFSFGAASDQKAHIYVIYIYSNILQYNSTFIL
jgi:hypothetical protein